MGLPHRSCRFGPLTAAVARHWVVVRTNEHQSGFACLRRLDREACRCVGAAGRAVRRRASRAPALSPRLETADAGVRALLLGFDDKLARRVPRAAAAAALGPRARRSSNRVRETSPASRLESIPLRLRWL